MTAGTDANPRVTLIVACARDGVIGRDNRLPWRLPEDLRHFTAATLGHLLVMGRRTFDSIGRPLPGRETIVLSRDPAWQADGCLHAATLEQAIALARALQHREVFVAGGEQVYRQALLIADRVLLTEIDLQVVGDAYFPPLPAAQWREHSREERVGADGTRFAIVDCRRVADSTPQSPQAGS